MGIEEFAPPEEKNKNQPNRPNNAPVRLEMADRVAKGTEKVNWKYANPERAAMFRRLFPELKATDAEIEEAAWYVNNFEYREALNKAWEDNVFHRLMKLHILEKRDSDKVEKKLIWKYANPKRATMFKRRFPDLKATDAEIEKTAWFVFQFIYKEAGNLDKAWKDPTFLTLIQKNILTNRGK